MLNQQLPAHTLIAPSRELPHNIDAEQALIGALLIDNDTLDRVAEVVTPTAFFEPLHARIWSAAVAMISSGRRADPITLRPAFEAEPDIAPGMTVPGYLGRLVAGAVTVAGAREYARTIRDLATRRAVVRICDEAAASARDLPPDRSPSTIVEAIESELFALAERGTSGRAVTFAEALDAAMRDVDAAFRSGSGIRGIPTGFSDLDRALGGLAPGALYVVAGRPGMGKTALATNIAWNAASRGVPVSFFSLEMPDSELALRVAAAESGVSSERARRGAIESAEASDLMRAAQRIRDRKLFIDQRGGITIAQLVARARRQKRRHATALIVIDYLQLLAGGGRSAAAGRVQEITEITTGLKALAKELEVPIIALSQLSRQVEQRENKRPQLSDLRESGSIEQDADAVIFVYREEYYLANTKPDGDGAKLAEWQRKLADASGKAEAIVAKNRHGRTATVELQFDGALTRFSGLAREAVH